jgi:hypothetical protein
MSVEGQSRRFEPQPATSGLTPSSDMSLRRENCREVPLPEVSFDSLASS